ncbi:hypothetical protein [Burkholderia gladioli]|uniref:hypothetical protein n=1 Tax=Burkholderia gladioli TaxID=28095 RepID=UPI00163FF32A|nr:hypothetical protein [Burkholderia gladioli]MDN7742092.1 hypothetical protein [Burkholderia gladioli]
MKKKQYKDSFCRPIVTDKGTKIAGGSARNYRIAQFDDGIDEIIEMASAAAARTVHEALFDRMAEKQARRISRTPIAPSSGLSN